MIKEYFALNDKKEVRNACAQLGIKYTENRMFYVYCEDDIIRCGIEHSIDDDILFIYGLLHRDYNISIDFVRRIMLAFLNYIEAIDVKKIVVKSHFFDDNKEYIELMEKLGFSLQSRGDMTFIF